MFAFELEGLAEVEELDAVGTEVAEGTGVGVGADDGNGVVLDVVVDDAVGGGGGGGKLSFCLMSSFLKMRKKSFKLASFEMTFVCHFVTNLDCNSC